MTFKSEFSALLTTTTSVSNPLKQRLASAIGREMGLTNPDGSQRNATADEIADFVIRTIRVKVRMIEEKPAPSDFDL